MDTSGRRRFLIAFLAGLGGAAAAAVVWPVYRFLAPKGGGDAAATVVIQEGEVGEGQAKFFQYAGASAVLVRKAGGELVALSAVCTHLGCVVQWRKEKQDFLCPCHGGVFSSEGAVLAGPPPKPLARIPFRVEGGRVTIGVTA